MLHDPFDSTETLALDTGPDDDLVSATPDYQHCQRCAAAFLPSPSRAPRHPKRDPPEGISVAYYLCAACVRETGAQRSRVWGWTYQTPGAERTRWRAHDNTLGGLLVPQPSDLVIPVEPERPPPEP